jgi:CP family cyanate transporter-like MFS transporter
MAVWRTPLVWRVALAFACYSGQWLVVIGFLPTLLQGGSTSAAAAGILAAIASAANIAGNLMGGRLLQRGVPSQKILTIGFAAMAIGAIVIFSVQPTTTISIKLAAVLVFSGVGGMIPASLFSLAVKDAPCDHTASIALGWTTQMSMLGQFCMPPTVALLATVHGGWGLSWVVTGGLCLVGVGLVGPRRA